MLLVLWLLCYLVAGTPALHEWNVWLVTLVVGAALTVYGIGTQEVERAASMLRGLALRFQRLGRDQPGRVAFLDLDGDDDGAVGVARLERPVLRVQVDVGEYRPRRFLRREAAVKLLSGTKKTPDGAASLSVNDDVRLSTPDGEQVWKTGEGQFPNLQQITPTDYSTFRVGLNPAMLLETAKALGDGEAVVLEFTLQRDKVEGDDTGAYPDALRPIRVTVPNGGESYGILMPRQTP